MNLFIEQQQLQQHRLLGTLLFYFLKIKWMNSKIVVLQQVAVHPGIYLVILFIKNKFSYFDDLSSTTSTTSTSSTYVFIWYSILIIYQRSNFLFILIKERQHQQQVLRKISFWIFMDSMLVLFYRTTSTSTTSTTATTTTEKRLF